MTDQPRIHLDDVMAATQAVADRHAEIDAAHLAAYESARPEEDGRIESYTGESSALET